MVKIVAKVIEMIFTYFTYIYHSLSPVFSVGVDSRAKAFYPPNTSLHTVCCISYNFLDVTSQF